MVRDQLAKTAHGYGHQLDILRVAGQEEGLKDILILAQNWKEK